MQAGDTLPPPREPSDLEGAPLIPPAVDGSHDNFGGDPIDADKGWAIAFKINVVATLISAMFFGTTAFEPVANGLLSGAKRRRLQLGDSVEDTGDEDGGHVLFNFLVGSTILIAVAGLLAAGMLHFLHYGRGLLFSSIAFVVVAMGVVAVFLAVVLHPIAAVIPALLCAGLVILIHRGRHRIEFCAANLKVAALPINTMPWTVRSALLLGVLQCVWSFVAAIAAFGSYITLETVSAPDGTSHRAIYCHTDILDKSCMCNGSKISDDECEFGGLGVPVLIVWLLSMGWGCTVIKNVVTCTVTGSVASWWFKPNEDAAPVKGAFHRATHSCFGSLCKAAVVQNVMTGVTCIVIRVLRCVACAACLLSQANRAMHYILSYAIVFVSIYGVSFNEAGRRVRQLFKRHGCTAIANDVVVDFGLSMLSIAMGLIYGLIGFLLVSLLVTPEGKLTHKKDGDRMDLLELSSIYGSLIFGAVTLMLLASTIVEVVRAGFKAVFVCFVQDPESLARKHSPELHQDLSAAWIRIRTGSSRPAAVNLAQPQLLVSVN